MFDLGIQELVLIFVVALLVFGPKRLPEIAHAMGKGIAEMKKALSGVKDQIDAELHDVKDINALKGLDPISLKNELFKSEDLFKINEAPQAQPQQKVEGPQEDPQQKVEGSQEEQQQKVEGSQEERLVLLNEISMAQKALIRARGKLAGLKPEVEQQKSGEMPDQSSDQKERKVQE